MGKKQAICLCAIVRDESAVIGRLIDSVRPIITHWAIVDTGSTDGTQEIIRQKLGDLPGRLIEHEWTDFSTERNRSLELGRKVLGDDIADAYLMTIDADEVLVFMAENFEMPHLEAGSYALPFKLGDTDQIWARRVFVRAEMPWRYEGEIHERLECDEPFENGVSENLGVWGKTDGARNKNGSVEKCRRDAKLLRRLCKKYPKDPRNWFYLGQTYSGALEFDKAIWAYQKRLELQGFNEERYAALFQIACLREARGDHIDDVKAAHMAAFNERPTRAEPMWALAVICNENGEHALAEVYARAACRIPRPPDSLVVSESIYTWRCADELAGALAKQGKYRDAHMVIQRLLASDNLPKDHRPRLLENLQMLEAEMAKTEAA